MKKKILACSLSLVSILVMAGNREYSPFTFWYWMYGAVSKEGIHADLVGMKNVGLRGCYLMPIRAAKERLEYHGEADALSPKFWNMVDYSFQQADSLGLEMGIHICDGFALAGGPWISPAESMQKVVWTDTVVSVKDLLKGVAVRQPESYEGYYEDIATFAIPFTETPRTYAPKHISVSENVSTAKGFYLATRPGAITFEYDSPILVRSMKVRPNGNNIQSQRLLVESSTDGVNFRSVKQLIPPRQGWQNTGFDYTFTLPETRARYFRFSWTPDGSEPGAEDLDAAKWKPLLKLNDIILSSDGLINQYEGKSGAVWRIDKDTITPTHYILSKDIHRIEQYGDIAKWSKKERNKGKGLVRILRMGHTSTGQTNATAGGAKGLEVDKFNAEAVDKQIEGWFEKFIERPHHHVVKYLHVDSWECGSQNWGRDFDKEFQKRRGYDIVRYLPLYAGIPIESNSVSERVLKDVRQTISDLVSDIFFAQVGKRGHELGMQVSQESIAPTFVADGLEHYKYADLPMGEYWLNSPTHDKPNDMLDAVSGAYIYGKNIVQAEGFTEVRGVWNETPAMIKPMLDHNFCIGMNRLFFHVNTHNPWMDRKPGMTLDGIGLFFQRDNTWYSEARGMVDYITRCQELLQRGQAVADIAVFTGEEIPARALTPDKIVNFLPGIFGTERVESERQRIANIGQPMVESPVNVQHNANIFSLDGWNNTMNGYQYVSINKDAIQSGIADNLFSILIVPDSIQSGTIKERIRVLRKKGKVVIDKVYTKNDFASFGIPRDVILPKGIDYRHRDNGDEQIYFLSNQENKAVDFTASLRAVGYKYVTIYDPLHDVYTQTNNISRDGRRTDVRISLFSYGSCFILLTNSPVDIAQPLMMQKDMQVVNGQWSIKYDKISVDKKVDLPHDWSKSDHLSERYYSGHATYSTTFKYKCHESSRVILNVGEIHDVARVIVNGVDCGIVWTAPYDVDITKAVSRGINSLDIQVVNTWRNALLGKDKGLPPFENIWTNARYRMKGEELLPAGLFGPVTIKIMGI